MLHPVGDLAPSVYWRRRVLLVAALVLVILSGYALLTGGSSTPSGAPTDGTSTSVGGSSSSSGSSASTPTSASSTPSVSRTSSTPAEVIACSKSQLAISAATDAKSYPVGAKPELSLVVKNRGPRPCIADLADRQIELRVYAGSARVWGSHDCQIAPGTSPATLPVGQPISRQIQWSGLSSQVACAGVRQRVPAGTYTVYAYLSGQQGTPASFTFTS